MSFGNRTSNIKYYLLLALPLLVFIFVFNFPSPPWSDGMVYDAVGRDLLNNGVFRYFIWSDFDASYLRANFNNCILYPLVHLTSLKLFASTDSRILIFLNYLLAFLILINIKTIFNLKGNRLLLLVLFAFNPLVYQYTNFQRPELLNIFFFTSMWICLNRRSYILAALFLALSAYTHQFSIFFVPCIAYGIWRQERGFASISRSYLKVLVATSLFLLPFIYYTIIHFADFKYQLFGNQMGMSSSSSLTAFARSFFVPLFAPSMSFYTITGIIPRWFANILNVGAIFALIALIIKFKNKTTFSAITREAGVFWLIINLGCSFQTYNPYVAVFLTIFVIGIFADLYPEIPTWLEKTLISVVIVSLAYQFIFFSWVKKDLFQWKDLTAATECIAEKLPEGAKIYSLAYPDPSIQLINLRPDLNIKRYIDFKKYAPLWEKTVKENNYFITSEDGYYLKRFDFNSTLRNEIGKGVLSGVECRSGNINFKLWTRKQ